jgi:hypothetical protein
MDLRPDQLYAIVLGMADNAYYMFSLHPDGTIGNIMPTYLYYSERIILYPFIWNSKLYVLEPFYATIRVWRPDQRTHCLTTRCGSYAVPDDIDRPMETDVIQHLCNDGRIVRSIHVCTSGFLYVSYPGRVIRINMNNHTYRVLRHHYHPYDIPSCYIDIRPTWYDRATDSNYVIESGKHIDSISVCSLTEGVGLIRIPGLIDDNVSLANSRVCGERLILLEAVGDAVITYSMTTKLQLEHFEYSQPTDILHVESEHVQISFSTQTIARSDSLVISATYRNLADNTFYNITWQTNIRCAMMAVMG